ncbi:AAA family ATPase [Cupriavidus plantarum]|uniref:AAA family ATPase n=1 Tax=Cupriavidus plantarum TaxID=942865 RepID=UPI000D6B6460|nr:AAA family ATPase [Cupriavidus plantarum]
MSILQEIQKWSQGLPGWQQHAITQLYAKGELDDNDYEDLYALLKAEHGIPDPKNRVAAKLEAAQVAAPQASNRRVQLDGIKNLFNVNALAENQDLSISPTGLTIIYGPNGAGKSGYSRVLKKACRARDQREPILSNAKEAAGKKTPAQATFDLLIDGMPLQVTWTNGQEAPEQLSALSIFDSHCARAYVDNQGDFAYSPYGIDILEGLVSACGKLRAMCGKDLAAATPNTEPFANLSKSSTAVGKLLSTLSYRTRIEEVEALASLSEAENERLAILTKTLAEADPKQKAQNLRNRAIRIAGLVQRVGVAIAMVDEAKVRALKEHVENARATKAAAELAANTFKETPGLLPGTGGEAWKSLFEAARTFATESHPPKIFPHLGAESSCPLCQNPLGAYGAAKLLAFDAFIQQAAEKAARTARQNAIAAYREIEEATLDLRVDQPLFQELEESLATSGEACRALQEALIARRSAVLGATKADGDWLAVPALPNDPREILAAIQTRFVTEAQALEQSGDAKTRLQLASEHAELDARQKLADMKASVIGAIGKFTLSKRLQACSTATATMGISRKATDLAKTMATPEVARVLNEELRSLDVHELQVVMKNASPQGRTQFKLALELPGGGSPEAILSEGEQRAIAIAAFLTEVGLGGGSGGIIFDDPVSSLDHRRRWHVARRLAIEATRRQVIVFTHDIYFLCILEQEADSAGASYLAQCIRKGQAGFGVPTDRLPFDTLSTSKRVKALRVMHEAVAKAHKANDEDEARRLTRDAYYHLRLAWERGVEEVLFQGVVTRFGEGISTQMLRYVVVEDDDYTIVHAGMSKSSKFAHDPATAAQLPTPHPDELRGDIEGLETWRDSIEKRKKAIEARRS